MIRLKTNCNNCIHNKTCKFKGHAEEDMKKLKNMIYGDGPNDDYNWDTMLESRHVNVDFSCPDYDGRYIFYI